MSLTCFFGSPQKRPSERIPLFHHSPRAHPQAIPYSQPRWSRSFRGVFQTVRCVGFTTLDSDTNYPFLLSLYIFG